MAALRLHANKGGSLTFDLKEVLAALGPSGMALHWTVSNVPTKGGGFDATGEGATALEGLAASGERVSGSRLTQIAKSVQQVIWGEFQGYDDAQTATPHVVVSAIDSSWWEVRTADQPLLEKVARAFDHVERL